MAHEVFISHSSQDKPIADAVCAALENTAIRCWIAPRDLQPGRSFAGEITRAIQRSKVMVLIFSAHSNASEQVLREVQLAANSHLHIVQFRIADVNPNDDLEYYLSAPHWLDALTPPLEDNLQRLGTSVKALLEMAAEEPAEGGMMPVAPLVDFRAERSQLDSVATAKDPTTPAKSTQTTRSQPPISPAASISAIAASKEPALWRRKRLIIVTAGGATVLLLIAITALLTRPHPPVRKAASTSPEPVLKPAVPEFDAVTQEMYNAAYKAFDSNKFPEALKQLDALDAWRPDLAFSGSKNLRGVILMRQGNYDQAETALQDAVRIAPKFWNARFNLAEIPFLKKDWPQARKRFEQLLSPDLAKEATQMIQYKIFLTYLIEGKGNMVDSMLAKLELSTDTPVVDYVKAAVALQQKNQNEAKDWINAAEKNFSPQLNKLFAESLYEVGWLEKPAGTARPSLPLMTAAERKEKTKAVARSEFEQSQQALRQRDFSTALKLVDQADQADPNQPATLNFRGEILMQQQQFDQAEAAFKKAAKLDPKFREAQYNLAQIPFKKKDYAKARERFETLYKRTPGGDKNQAAELIKFKIYMTLLLEGKESRAHSMMEEFQFTGDTPALYYAQAAWEYKHNNPEKAADWTGSANKIYSPALNSVFADAFYDVGWMQRPEGSTAPALAFDTTNAGASQAEGGPAIEPSPIPESVAAANKQGETVKTESLAFSDLAANNPSSGAEGTTLGTSSEQSAVSAPSEPLA